MPETAADVVDTTGCGLAWSGMSITLGMTLPAPERVLAPEGIGYHGGSFQREQEMCRDKAFRKQSNGLENRRQEHHYPLVFGQ
jgi:hypothetical protein